jgi:hypothetical protein
MLHCDASGGKVDLFFFAAEKATHGTDEVC